MPFAELVRVAFASIGANKLRSFLATLSIVIGIGSVVTMVALGEGARRSLSERLGNLGANVLTVRAGQQFFGGLSRGQAPLTVDDAFALAEDQGLTGVPIAPEMAGRFQVEFEASNANLPVIGTWTDYFTIQSSKLVSGRLFDEREERAHRRVAVVGALVADSLGVSGADLVGRTIHVAGAPFEVVGALAEKGFAGSANPDGSVFVPLSTARLRLFGNDRLRSIGLQAPTPAAILALTVDIDRILRREHRIPPGQNADFTIGDQAALLDAVRASELTLSFLLAGIAAISLLVGGLGIMNIMLVSVTERTREIGLRRALGARRGDIRRQFLVEALALCLVGGALGLGLGWSVSVLLERLAGWNIAVTPVSAVVAVVFSSAVGVGFGLWPARRAAALLPIEALRHE